MVLQSEVVGRYVQSWVMMGELALLVDDPELVARIRQDGLAEPLHPAVLQIPRGVSSRTWAVRACCAACCTARPWPLGIRFLLCCYAPSQWTARLAAVWPHTLQPLPDAYSVNMASRIIEAIR